LTRSPEVGSTKRRQVSRIEKITAITPRTVEFRLTKPHATWRLGINFEITPKHLFQPGVIDDPSVRSSEYFEALHRRPVGSGPFRFVSWTDDEIRLERFDGYGDEAPSVGGVVIRWIESPDRRLAAFLAGDMDLIDLSFEQYRDHIQSDEFRAAGLDARRPSSRYHTIFWNCDDKAHGFNNPDVRRAMTLAIDIDRIKAEVTNNLAAACYGPWPVDSPYFDPMVRRFAHRPSRAGELLEKADWTRDADGRRSRASASADAPRDPLAFELLVYDRGEAGKKTAEIIRDCLADVGVKISIATESDRSTLIDRLEDGDFDACLLATTPAVDPELHYPEFASGNKRNFCRYSNSDVDRLFAEASKTIDEDKRAAIFREIHRLIYADQPRTFLYHEPALWAVSHRLSGVTFSSRGPYYFQPGVSGWWVPAGSSQ